jgi:hypothetical protein
MNDLIKGLIGGILVGFGFSKIIESENAEKDKKKKEEDTGFFVFVRSEQFGNAEMLFEKYDDARNLYYKILKTKKVIFKDLYDNSQFERDLFKKLEENKNDEDRLHLNDESLVEEISWGDSKNTFEKKRF